jgi:hypothetical protein
VAIHGLLGNRNNTWKATGNNKTMWLTDLLPSRIDHARIMTFDYQILGEQGVSSANISTISLKLLESLLEERGGTSVCSTQNKTHELLENFRVDRGSFPSSRIAPSSSSVMDLEASLLKR